MAFMTRTRFQRWRPGRNGAWTWMPGYRPTRSDARTLGRRERQTPALRILKAIFAQGRGKSA